jgi:nuclear transport factor 2 (NTF2) superfamily protein
MKGRYEAVGNYILGRHTLYMPMVSLDERGVTEFDERDREYHWPLGRRPDDHPGLSDLGL